MPLPVEASSESPNVLHATSPSDATWSSINLAEAVPGVMTPLCASVWVPASELGLRLPFHAMGALASALKSIPDDPAARITNAFHGRMTVRVDFLCDMGGPPSIPRSCFEAPPTRRGRIVHRVY